MCLSDGNKYHVDITFRKMPSADPQISSYILIDSVRFQTIRPCFCKIIGKDEIENDLSIV